MMKKTIVAAGILAHSMFLMLGAGGAVASSHQLSGHICDPYASQTQGRYIREREGAIVNISVDRTITVSCPVPLGGIENYASVIAIVGNSGRSAQVISCQLRSMDPGNNIVRSRKEAVLVSVGAWDLVQMEFRKGATTDTFDLICTLPPGTTLNVIDIYGEV